MQVNIWPVLARQRRFFREGDFSASPLRQAVVRRRTRVPSRYACAKAKQQKGKSVVEAEKLALHGWKERGGIRKRWNNWPF